MLGMLGIGKANMTREEFFASYAARSGVTVAWLQEKGEALPCHCGEDGCQGWQMLSAEGAAVVRELEKIHGISDG
jgi:hypothetical protein